MDFSAIALIAWLAVVLHDLEGEPPLFNLQNEGTRPGSAYYLCYLYPRPQWYVEQVRTRIDLILGKQ